jgi:hypothetical protein
MMMESLEILWRSSHRRPMHDLGSKMHNNGPVTWVIVERILFFLGLLLLAHPFLRQRYYFTVDGPAHVYDAWLILELFHHSAGIIPLWELNPLPVPDWSGHALLALLLTVLDPPEAVKVVHLLCVLGFVIAFRMVVAQRMKGPLWLSYLAFPFAVSAPFTMGYFNFVLALPLLMLIIRQWRRIAEEERSKAGWIGFSALLLACYFSHLMPFLFAVLWIVAQLIESWWRVLMKKGGAPERLLRRTLFLGLAVLPSLILLAWYFIGSPAGTSWIEPPKDRLGQVWRPFVIVDRLPELILWSSAVYLILLAFLFGTAKGRSVRRPGSVAALAYATVMLLSISFLPDGFENGSDILYRLSVLAHIAFLVAVPFVALAPRRGASLAVAALLITFAQQETRAPAFDGNTGLLKSVTKQCAQGPPGRTVAFIPLQWNYAHMPELGFIRPKAIDYSLYELNLAHFPLRWGAGHLQMLQAAPPDPLDALGGMSGVPGAVLRTCDEVVLIGETSNDQQWEQVQLLERELAATHTEDQGNGPCRIFWRNDRGGG